MRVFMLGWEFPPFISGGLGTACYGLTKALSRMNTRINFVLPKSVGTEYSSHVRLLSPQSSNAAMGSRSPDTAAAGFQYDPTTSGLADDAADFANVTFRAVPARMVSPYQSAGGKLHAGQTLHQPISVLGSAHVAASSQTGAQASPYAGDLIAETRRYAALCVGLARGEEFDVVHAHDWMTYPAGMAVAAVTGKPLVIHVHSTEFDRSGTNINRIVYELERRGMHAACRVIAVSYMTRSIIEHRYGVNPDKIDVVYNG
ncbi:MAG: glycosyltransferase, partial [Phycisphaeraceae bacterium]